MKHGILFLKRMGIAYGLYFVFRVLFLLFHFTDLITMGFAQIVKGTFVGLIFDSSAIVYTFSLFILLSILPLKIRNKNWYQTTLFILFLLPAAIGIILTVLDLNWIKYTGKRSGIELFSIITDDGNNISTYLIDYWYLIILILFLFYLTYKVYPRLKSPFKTSLIKELGFFLVVAAFALLGARGGLGLKPIKSFAAAKYVEPELVNYTLNTPFNIISTVEGEEIARAKFMEDKEVERIVQARKSYYKKSNPITKQNVVVIILESFGREYVGHLGGPIPSTPFLDSLAKKPDCLSLESFYANGTKSMEAVPSIFSGIPSWMDLSFINSIYQTNKVENIGALLGKQDYTSAFFHGSNNGTMGFQNFLKMGGMGSYFGIDEYPDKEKDFDGNWGIYDGPYFQHFLEYINKVKKPTFAGIFTLSSHHPYPIPQDLKHKFEHIEDEISRGVAYTDYSLEQFFIEAKKQDWFENTLFIITADHSSKGDSKYFRYAPGKYEVPCMFYIPNHNWEPNLKYIEGSHMDLLPTIMELVNYPDSFFAIGNSVFSQPNEYEILYSDGLYWIRDAEYYWVTMTSEGELKHYFRKQKGAEGRAYKILDKRAEVMHTYLKAYIQTYRNSIIDNKMKVR